MSNLKAKTAFRPVSKNWLVTILVIVMLLKLIGFFTFFPNNLALTRVIKLGVRLMMTGVAFMMLQYLRSRGYYYKHKFHESLPLMLYCAYLLLGLFSVLWSTDKVKSMLQLSMNADLFYFVFIYYKVYVCYNFNSKEENKIRLTQIIGPAIFLIMAWMIIGSIINPLVYLRPTHGLQVWRLGGEMMNPNELGMLAVVGACCMILELFYSNKKVIPILFTGACVYALWLTESRSSFVGFGIIMLYLILKSDNALLKFGSLASMVFIAPVVFNAIFLKMGNMDEILSMTGRLPFWKALLTESFPQEPIKGYGFMRIAYTDKFHSLTSYTAAMSHNTFVQVILNLGLIGVFVVLMQMIATFRAFLKEKESFIKDTSLALFVPIFINSLTEFGIFGETNFGILFYLFIIFMLVMRINPLMNRADKIRFKYNPAVHALH